MRWCWVVPKMYLYNRKALVTKSKQYVEDGDEDDDYVGYGISRAASLNKLTCNQR